MATEIDSDVSELLEKLHEKLKFLEGRRFELQGAVEIKRNAKMLRLAIWPLELITIECMTDGMWVVDFNINDAAGHGLPWSHQGSYGHVINSWRGYLVKVMAPLVTDQELRELATLD